MVDEGDLGKSNDVNNDDGAGLAREVSMEGDNHQDDNYSLARKKTMINAASRQ